jgi:hypothetical protein
MPASFPFKFINVGMPVPFDIEANPDFPDETGPLLMVTNLGSPPAPDTFITLGAGVPPNGPDPWELTFRWATVGGPATGEWQLEAFLHSISGPGPSVALAGLVIPSVTPHKHDVVVTVPPDLIAPPPGVFLYRLYATLRWAPLAGPVRVAGRAEGPLMEFYFPA